MQEYESFDVVIIGGGPAGMSAALWCDELGLNTQMVESGSELGGQLKWTYNEISNYLGATVSNGTELRDKFLANLGPRNTSVRYGFKVGEIDLKNRRLLSLNGDSMGFRALVIAAGVRRRCLGVPGEQEFKGKGILSSGKKEKGIVAGKNVVIVGGGDAALENIQILSETAKRIYLVHRRSEFRARAEFVEFAKDCPIVDIVTNSVITEIAGDGAVESVAIRNLETEQVTRVSTAAVLIRIGVQPNTEFLPKRVARDNEGYIKINHLCETSVPLVFAVGDIANPLSPTISSAAGMGATAAKVVYSKLR